MLYFDIFYKTGVGVVYLFNRLYRKLVVSIYEMHINAVYCNCLFIILFRFISGCMSDSKVNSGLTKCDPWI